MTFPSYVLVRPAACLLNRSPKFTGRFRRELLNAIERAPSIRTVCESSWLA